MTSRNMPPLGVRLTIDVDRRDLLEPRYDARVRWTDPVTRRRHGVKRTFLTPEAAQSWVDNMERSAKTGIDTGQTLREYVDALGDRWTRTIDPTSTLDPRPSTRTLRASGCGSCQPWDIYRSE